jgi:hypothetical protein
MKLELIKETKVDIAEPSGQKTWYWVVVNGIRIGPSNVFHDQEQAQKYYDGLKAFHLNHGTFESVKETLQSETIETPTNEPA